MIIREITISIGRTINLGNYNNLKIEASATATVEGDNNPDTIRDRLIERCNLDLQAAYRASKGEKF